MFVCWLDILESDEASEYGLDVPEFNDPMLRRHRFSPPRYIEDYEILVDFFTRKFGIEELTYYQGQMIKLYLLRYYYIGYGQLIRYMQHELNICQGWTIPRLDGQPLMYYMRKMYQSQLDLNARMCNMQNEFLQDSTFKVSDYFFIVSKLINIDL